MATRPMKRKTGIERQIANYINQEEEVKEMCRDYVFNTYLSRSSGDYKEALDHILGDMYLLESMEEYESCLILKEILKDFG